MRIRTRSLYVLGMALTVFCLPLSAVTLTVDSDGGTYTTIQSAVDAAVAGDIINIKPHHEPKGYRENVVIDTPGLTLRGSGSAGASQSGQRCPRVILDGCETPSAPSACEATVLQVNEPDVRIQSLTLRHGGLEIDAADRTLIEKICVIDGRNDAISTINEVSNDVIVRRSVFQGGSATSILIDGDNAQVLSNKLYLADDGARVNGNGALVKSNRFSSCNDTCIQINGDGGQVERNIIDGGDDGIDYNGDQPMIINNRISGMYDDPINVRCIGCTGGTISRNRIDGPADDDEGIQIFEALNILIERNTITNIDQTAIDLEGDSNTIRNNRIARAGTESYLNESCIEVEGSLNVIENNRISFCTFQGIRQQLGDGNVYTNNRITGTGRAGIEIEDGTDTLIANNTITGSQGEGIANNGGTNTDIENNKIKGSRTDICNDIINASVDSFFGNTFTTGDDTTNCVVDIFDP